MFGTKIRRGSDGYIPTGMPREGRSKSEIYLGGNISRGKNALSVAQHCEGLGSEIGPREAERVRRELALRPDVEPDPKRLDVWRLKM